MRTISTLLFTALLAFSANAQKTNLKLGQKYMASLQYMEAIELYNRVLKNHDVSEAKINLAEAYRKVNDTENAEFWYGQVVRLSEAEPIHKLYYGMMLQRNGKCELAKEWYQQYVDGVPDDLRGQYLLRACDYEDELMDKNSGIFEVRQCDFNSDLDDFSPYYYKNGLVFTSERDVNPMIKRDHTWTGNPFLELYYVDVRETGGEEENNLCGNYIFGRPEKFSNKLNSKFHEASVAFTNNEKEIYFTRNNFLDGKKEFDDEGIMRLKVYYATNLGEGKWGDLQSLPFNSDEYSVAHPALGPGATKLFFASDMPGGFGGMDIYVSEKESGRWGPPLNLGPEVNTEGHEVFPYVAPDERLYFSSDGHIGLGGLDLFYIEERGENTWTSPENLGFPVNTISDDFGVVFNEAGTCGFFSSDRQGGVGGDDIYSFKKTAAPVEVYVYDEKSNLPIEGASVYIASKDETMTTDATGKVLFDLKLGDCTNVKASMEEYENNEKEGCASDINMGDKVKVEIPLNRLSAFDLEGFVFDQGLGLPMEGAVVTLENDCDAPTPEPVFTDRFGRFYFKLDKECCYKIKAVKEGYLAGVIEDKCTKGIEDSETFKVKIHLQPMAINIDPDAGGDIVNNNQVETLTENEYAYVDVVTGLWIDKDNGLPADGEYPDGRVYEKGVLKGGNYPVKPQQIVDGAGIEIGDTGERSVSIPYLLHIYYDFDQSYIRDDAISELEKLQGTLTENPDIIVEIGSHTDARGTNRYNIRLSQRRAESVVRWLVEKGIARDRLVPRGYGESVNVNNCSNNVPCSEREHQMNRRTEFKVIGCISCIDPAKALISEKPEAVKLGKGCTDCPF